MKTKINDSDPRLTAYALGELPLHEADEVAKLLQADAALQTEVDSIEEISQLLSAGLGAETALKLKPKQRAKVYQSGKISTLAEVPSGQKKQWLRPFVVIAGAAAVVTLSFMVMNSIDGGNSHAGSFADADTEAYGKNPRIQANSTAWVPSSGDQSGGPSIGHGDASVTDTGHATESGTQEESANMKDGWEARANSAMTRVPLSSEDYSWAWIEDWAENGGDTALNSDLVRVEEIINHFSYNEPADMMVDKVQVGVSLVQCPWAPSHQIAVILVKNIGLESSDIAKVEAGLTFSDNVAQYRLLGHKKSKGANYAKYAPAVTELEPGQSHLVIYELELEEDFKALDNLGSEVVSLSVRSISEAANESGSLVSQVAEKSLNVQFSNVTWNVAPQDTQFAIILATWAQNMTENTKSDLPSMIQSFESENEISDEQNAALEIIQKSL